MVPKADFNGVLKSVAQQVNRDDCMDHIWEEEAEEKEDEEKEDEDMNFEQ